MQVTIIHVVGVAVLLVLVSLAILTLIFKQKIGVYVVDPMDFVVKKRNGEYLPVSPKKGGIHLSVPIIDEIHATVSSLKKADTYALKGETKDKVTVYAKLKMIHRLRSGPNGHPDPEAAKFWSSFGDDDQNDFLATAALTTASRHISATPLKQLKAGEMNKDFSNEVLRDMGRETLAIVLEDPDYPPDVRKMLDKLTEARVASTGVRMVAKTISSLPDARATDLAATLNAMNVATVTKRRGANLFYVAGGDSNSVGKMAALKLTSEESK